MTSGGLRTSVKGYLNAQRVTLALDPVHHENDNFSSVDSVQEDSTSYGLSICDGSIPCLPMLTSAAKQTSYADMLDLAVQHIKGLQNQVQSLHKDLEGCTCGCKEPPT